MLYLLIMVFPLAMSASCFLLRKQSELVIGVGVITLLVQTTLVLSLEPERPARFLGLSLTLEPLGQLFLLAMLIVVAATFLSTLRLPHGENFIPVALLVVGLHCIALLLQDPFTIALLLVSASILAVLAILDLPSGSNRLVGRSLITSALKYLVLMVVAGVMMFMAFTLIMLYEPGEVPERVSPAQLALALLMVAFGLRLALIPFHSWLPDLVDHAAPVVSMLVLVVMNSTSLLFLVQTLQLFPIIVFENGRGLVIMQVFGALTAIIGALLALAQTQLRRIVAYLSIHATGITMVGLASTYLSGVSGALFDAFNQILAIPLVLLSATLLELPDGRAPGTLRRDLIWRWPIAAFGFLGGCLALLGIPPFGGFPGHMLIYEAAAASHGLFFVALVASTAIALLALVRVASERMVGAPEDLAAPEVGLLLGQTELDRGMMRRREQAPRSATIILILLLLACLGLGIAPQPLLGVIHDLVQNMPFVAF